MFTSFYKAFLFVGCALMFSSTDAWGQVDLRVRINSGNSSTTCTDGFFGGAPEPQWRVNIAGQGWTTYPQAGICFNNPPNTQYDETFDCPSQYPATIQVCFRAFEDDGGVCIVSESCLQEVCQTYPTPAPGASATYTLNVGGSSSGSVNFTISATGAFNLPGSTNNIICNAIHLGTLPTGGSVGDNSLSNFGNYCANNVGDPNPPNWNNEQGVWFSFTTGPNPGAVITVDATNDPQGRGDQIDLQLALYQSSNGACNGTLTRINSEHTIPLYSESMDVECLLPNTTYYVLVDGADNGIFGGQEGFFGLEIFDNGIAQAGDQICQAQPLGVVPVGGAVATPNLSQSNVCATNINDPTPTTWAADQSVWYSFIAPPSGNVIVEADSDLPAPFGTDAIDIQLAVYGTNNGLCTGTLQYIDSEYDPGLFDEDLEVRCLVPGQMYWVMLDGSGLNVEGIFDVTIRDGGIYPAPNDAICNAIPLGQPAPNGTVGLNNQNNYCANNLFEPIPNNWGNDQGVWYTFIAPPSGKVEIRLDDQGLFSDQIDLQVAVYDASNMLCTGSLTELASEHEGIGLIFSEDMEVECLIPGRTYYILVDGEGSIFNPDLQEGVFDIEVYGDPRDPASPNDEICNAYALGDPTGGSVGTTQTNPAHHSQNNFCADAAGEPQPSGFTADQTVWYSFVAPSTGSVNISLETDALIFGEDPIDLQIAVWASSNNACTGTFTEELSGDDLLYDVDADLWCLIPGNTYFIQVDGAPPALIGGHEGYFDITVSEIPPIPVAPNDEICNAIALGNPFNGTLSISNQHNLCADDTGDPQPSAFGTDQTVWYTFTTPATGGPYAVNIEATSSLPWPFGNQNAVDLQVAVYQSSNNTCSGTLSEVASEYDFFFFDESVEVQCLEPGQTYFVMIDGSFLDDQGFFDLEISPATSVPIPTNDLMCNAIALGQVPIGGSINTNTNYFNFCADTEPGEPSPFGIDQTVWFSFQAPNHAGANATSEVTIFVESDPNGVGNAVDLQLAVYESGNGTCTGGMSLLEDGDDDPLFSFDAEVSVTCLTPGATYWVQVDGSALNVEGYFTIGIRDDGAGVHPPYDNLCTPVALGQVPNGGSINNGVNYQNHCSGTQPNEPNPDAFGIEQTVWFTFQAPASGNVTINLENDPNNVGDQIDLQVAVYYSSNNNCTGAFIEAGSDYNPFGFDESISLECLVPGGTYFVQVDGADGGLLGGEEGYFTIEIEDDGGTTNFPYNNDICNAYNFNTPTGMPQVLNNETNECANVQFGEPGVGGYATNTVWYQFTAPPSGRVEITVESSNIFLGIDPQVFLFSSSNNTCTGAFNEIESSNWPTALITENIEATCLIPGNTYFIQVDGSGLVEEGTFTIEVVDMEPLYGTGQSGDPEPANNYCNDATALTVQPSSCFNGNGAFTQVNYGQPTITYNPPFAQGCNDNCGDTWYSFTMPQSGIALVEGNDDNIGGGVIGDFSDLTVIAYSGTCNSLTPIACSAGGLLDDVSFEVAATPGSTVYLQVFNDAGEDDDEDFEICVSEGCGADNCLNALAYPIQPNTLYCFNTAAATGENVSGGAPGYVECGEGDNPEHSIYYYFVSDCNGSAVTLNIVNAVANGNCILGVTPSEGFGVSFFQDNTPCDGVPEALVDCQNFNSCDPQPINWSFTYTNLLPNTPYIIQIDGGFNFLGGDNAGYIMIQTTTNPVVIPTSTPVTCAGTNNGTATATVAGGVPPYTFLWSNGATDSIATGLASGTYSVTVTSSNGCTDTASVNVGNTGNLIANISTSVDVSCAGQCDGQATAAGSGGALGGYTYLWSDGQTTATATGLCPGAYTVSVSDATTCTATATVTILDALPMSASLTNSVDVTCGGFCDGSATVAGTGGTVAFDYAYQWPNGTTLATATGLCAGNYVVTVTDDNGCFDTVHVAINTPPGVTGSIANQTNILCNGGNNGSVEITATLGLPPYLYGINGGALSGSNIFNNLTAGNYSITVQDANGCQDTVGVVITQPTALAAALASSIDASCNGASDGQITIVATIGSGTAPYEYALDGINFQASGTFSNLAAGNYTITVRDANGCTTTVPATISEPTAIAVNTVAQTASGCGVCSGTANISVSGGSAPYTFAWSNGLTTEDATGLCAGTNEVTVTDANGCTTTHNVNILNSSGFAASSAVDQAISCAGVCDGAVSATPAGGTAPYTFAWANGATTPALTGLCAGSYTATITDANGCFVVQIVDLLDPAPLQTLVAELQPTNCAASNDGQAIATPSGGTPAYSFVWDNGETTQTATGLSSGNHVVTVSDANGCTVSNTVAVGAPAILTALIQNTTPSDCSSSGCNGSATIVATGGVAPYTYLWSNGNTVSNPTDLCPGFNDVTITDANGCTATDGINIIANSSLDLAIINTTNINCNGNCNGAAIVSASGGNVGGGYTFAWDNGATTAAVTGLCAGTYRVTVTDIDGCLAADTVAITEPPALNLSIDSISHVSCFGGSDGYLGASCFGGTGALTYMWSNGEIGPSIGGLNFGIGPGIYCVTVTDANGCTASTCATVTEPSAITPTATVTSSYSGFNISCNGNNDGSADASATGGTPPYTFAWDNGETTQTATGLNAGNHVVTVTDANGCTVATSVLLTEPTVLTSTPSVVQSVSCFGNNNGAADANPSGGILPYTFVWDNGETTQTATGLNAGNHAVTVTDANGCTVAASVLLTEPAVLTTTPALVQQVSCFGGNDGSADANPSGGTLPYTFAWDNGETTQTATGLNAGTHSLTLTDANGCTTTGSILITEPTLLQAAASSTNTLCFGSSGGSVTATPSGGTPNYNYMWNNLQMTATVPNLPAGTYSVTITDANGCTATATTTVTEPSAITVSTAVISNYNGAQISCPESEDGIATVTSGGGTGTHTYHWTNGETTTTVTGLEASNYYVTVTDANGCVAFDSVTVIPPTWITATTSITSNYNGFNVSCANGNDGTATVSATGGTGTLSYQWSNGQTTTAATGMSPGVYWITITDINGCFIETGDSLTAPPALALAINNVQNVTCNGLLNGQATAVFSGGLAPYQVLWSNGATSATNTGLGAGMHSVTITDANGCTISQNVIVNEPSLLGISNTATTPISCNGGNNGTATVTANGGTTPYQYQWSNAQTTQTATGLIAGTYTVTITDANGCTVSTSVTVIQPTPIATIATVTSNYNGAQISCDGAADGSAQASASGGIPGYTFQWNTGATAASITGLIAGTYTVTTTDANGCTASTSVTLNDPAPVAGIATVTSNYNGQDISCFGSSNGTAIVTPTGGTPTYTFQWSNGQTTATATGLASGAYTVVITDANGCEGLASVDIVPPPALVATVTINDHISCFGANDGVATAAASGGTPSYTFQWTNGQNTATVTALTLGVHTVTITDINGCSITASNIVNEPALLGVASTVVQMPNCAGSADGFAGVLMVGGTAPYSYQWSNGQTTATATGLMAGVHVVTITDANGCTATRSFTLFEPAPLGLQFADIQGVMCNNGSDGEARAIVTGGTSPYTFLWEGGSTANPATTLGFGYNNLTVTDANGCQIVDSVFIDNPNPLIVAGGQQNIDCFGNGNGSAQVSVSGGIAPYTYQWSTGETDTLINDLLPGIYTCTVTDARGCTEVISFTITQPAQALAISLLKLEDLLCAGDADGAITVHGTGGTADYTFQWSTGATQTGIAPFDPVGQTGLSGGNYSVTLTDANGCVAVLDTAIYEPTPVVASAIGSRTRCFDSADGTVTVSGAGGTEPYLYYVPGFAPTSNQVLTGLAAGTYTVGVVDANGCSDQTTATVTRPDSVVLVVPEAMTIDLGEQVELWVFMPINTPPNHQIWWTPSDGLACDTCNRTMAQPTETTHYIVTVMGSDSCPVSNGVWVYVNDIRDVFIPNAFTPNGDGINDAFVVYAGPEVRQVKRMMVFDRWGELVFESANTPTNFPGYFWDGTFLGKPMQSGVYAYYVELEFIDGVVQIFKGDVTLLK